MSIHVMRLELRNALIEVRTQMDEIIRECRADGMDPYAARTPSGEFILAPFIAAKAQLLCALASLEKV